MCIEDNIVCDKCFSDQVVLICEQGHLKCLSCDEEFAVLTTPDVGGYSDV